MPQFFELIPQLLEIFLNVLEFFAIIISVVTFFVLMIHKYSKALKKILGPCGMGFWARLKCMFICRKSQIKKRVFIEYAILQTGGNPVIPTEWYAIINRFKSFYSDAEQGVPEYILSNCTPLIESAVSEATARYFAYFSQEKVKRAFGIQTEPVGWIMRIRIEEAYATPTCLLTGLLSQYDESWEEFIKRYVSTAYISEDNDDENMGVLSNELYFTFAWLLWGPSYELEYRKYWAGLCQLSYGDESNSVPAIADAEGDVADTLRTRFRDNSTHRYGALLSARVAIYDKKPFYESMRSTINPDNMYFYDKVENGDLSFAVKIESFFPCENYKAKKYYSTAYVWVLFELEDGGLNFKPETSVAFFEHANLASKETYTFLIDTLIDKSLKHFEEIFSDERNRFRRYRFVCAMNDTIAEACARRYREIMASDTPFGRTLRERIIMEPKHTPAQIFTAYDEFFTPGKRMEYVEVLRSDRDSLSDFGQFYTEIYMEAFSNDDERESFDHFLSYLRKAETATDYCHHIVLAKDENGRVLGGCVFNYYPRRNAGVIEFLAVRGDMQSCGIGTQIYKHVESILSADSFRFRGEPLDYIFCEIDSPEFSRNEIKKYLYFWNKNNYWHLDFNYIQPALSAEQEPVKGLWFTVSPRKETHNEVPEGLVRDVVHDYVRYAMGIKDPDKNAEFAAMRAELEEKGSVALKKII